MVIRKLTML